MTDGYDIDVRRTNEIDDPDTCEMVFYYAWEKGQMIPIGVFDEDNDINENDYLSYELYPMYFTLSESERSSLDEVYIVYEYSYIASNPLYVALDESVIEDDNYWTLKPNISYVDPYKDGNTVGYFLVEMGEDTDDVEDALYDILDQLDFAGFTDFTKHMGFDSDDEMIVDYEYGMGIGSIRIGVNSTIGLSYNLTDFEELIDDLADQYSFTIEYHGRNKELLLDEMYRFDYEERSHIWSFFCYAGNKEDVQHILDAMYSEYSIYLDYDDEDTRDIMLKLMSRITFSNEELKSFAMDYVRSF